ncbi:MAG: NUDIX domain-containing protein [Candidatus Bathyarchaeia archaeon]
MLVVRENGKKFDLPGGAAKDGENRKNAAIRELEEETGLKAVDCCFLFECRGHIQKSVKGGFFQDFHKVYLIKINGAAKPKNEIEQVAFYTKNSSLSLSFAANRIIQKYLKQKGGINGDRN